MKAKRKNIHSNSLCNQPQYINKKEIEREKKRGLIQGYTQAINFLVSESRSGHHLTSPITPAARQGTRTRLKEVT